MDYSSRRQLTAINDERCFFEMVLEEVCLPCFLLATWRRRSRNEKNRWKMRSPEDTWSWVKEETAVHLQRPLRNKKMMLYRPMDAVVVVVVAVVVLLVLFIVPRISLLLLTKRAKWEKESPLYFTIIIIMVQASAVATATTTTKAT